MNGEPKPRAARSGGDHGKRHLRAIERADSQPRSRQRSSQRARHMDVGARRCRFDFNRVVRRRKRREFLGAGLFRQLGRDPATAWMVADVDLLSHRRIGSGNIAVSREITIGQFNPKLDVSVNANVHGIETSGFRPSYVFATPLFGGQASVGLLGIHGLGNDTTLNATAAATLGPFSSEDPLRSSKTPWALAICSQCLPSAGIPASTTIWPI